MGVLVVAVVVLGWLSLKRIPLEFLPAFSSSNITVSASYPSSSPEEVERLVVRPLEESLGTINGVETLSASASSDQGRVSVAFEDGTDMNLAAVEVRDRLDRVRHLLPDDLDRVSIRRFQSSDIPVLRFDLSASWPEARLYEFAETVVQRRLERLEGVAQVRLGGVRTPELQVNLIPDRMHAHRVDVRQLVTALRGNNVNVSAGSIDEGSRRLLVRAQVEFSSLDEIRRLPIDGAGLRLEDVAEVILDYPPQDDFNYLNGVEALTFSINKTSDANLLQVVDAAKAELAAIEAEPEAEGARVRIYSDASIDVRKGLGQLRDAGIVGGLLAVAAVYLFLRRLRTTLLVGLSIPVSVVTAFVLIYFLRQSGVIDMTLNVVSLAGLMLALGMLVDNSIVVIESVFRHRNELGRDAREAALAGASEVALPIIASTATTMCVFLPLIFVGTGGRFKVYFQAIGIMICIVIVASLLVALTVVPMAAARLLAGQATRAVSWNERLADRYAAALRFTLRHRLVFVLAISAMFAGAIYLFGTIERSFAGNQLDREVIVKVDTPRQYSLEQIHALYDEVYAILDGMREELDIADIAYSYDRSTGRSRASWRRDRQFNVYLLDEERSTRSTSAIRDAIRDALPVRAGVELRLQSAAGRHGSTGIEVQLMGDDPTVLKLLAQQLSEELTALPSIREVDTSLESGSEEIHVAPQAERTLLAGLSSQAVAFTVNNALSGRAVGSYSTGEREIDLVVRYREGDRETLDQLKTVPVFVESTPLPLGALADFRVVSGPQSIERENHLQQVTVTATTRDSSASFGALRAVRGMLERTPLPPGYDWSFGRWNRYQERDQQWGLFAVLFALPLVYMVLAALFESFTQPFTIMFSVPFALIGVAVVMKLADQPLDNMTTIGMIVLLGVVVNNAIVLVDHINALRRSGLPRTEAIVRGGRHRLRPIVITAVTTILGMLPMVAPIIAPAWFGPLEGRAANWAPIGLVIVGGLTTSTFLTLLIIPTLYSLVDDATRFLRRVAGAAS